MAVTYQGKKVKDNNILTRRTKGETVLFVIVFIIFVIQSISLFLPIVWMFLSSLKKPLEYAGGYAFDLPEDWLFSNYKLAFDVLNKGDVTFFGMIFNSLWYTTVVAVMSAFVPLVTGYVMSKYNFKAKPVIFALAITSMTIPIVGATASHLKIVHLLGLYDTPLYVVVSCFSGFGGSFLVYYGFYKNVSWSYAEAGMIDGASPFVIFFKIMLQQAMPIFLTYLITGAIACWNEYYVMILYIPSYPSLASGLYEYQATAIRLANYPVYFAGLIISMIPTIAIFAIFADKIMTNLSVGGLKG